MLGLNELKQSKVYQEALAEGKQQGLEAGKQQGKLEAIPRMIQFGLSLGGDRSIVRFTFGSSPASSTAISSISQYTW